MYRTGYPVTREALYEEVWKEPMTTVALRYGLSDVGLKKACARLLVPVPTRGYWARVQAGQTPRRAPLPPVKPGVQLPSGPRLLSEDEMTLRARTQAALREARERGTEITVPAELTDPLPLICAAATRLRQRDGRDDQTGLRSAPKEVLDIRVSGGSLDRALRLMDALLKGLAARGFVARIDHEKGVTELAGGGTILPMRLEEHVIRSEHEPTRAEVRARDRYYEGFRNGRAEPYPQIPRYDWRSTGRLTLTIGSYPSLRRWNDTDRTVLDDRLQEIVAMVIGLAEATRMREAEQERRRQAYAQAHAAYKAQVQARVDERERLRALMRDAARFQRASRLRAYVAAFESSRRQTGPLTPEAQAWADWARAKADWIDPLVQRPDPILDAPEPVAPNSWSF